MLSLLNRGVRAVFKIPRKQQQTTTKEKSFSLFHPGCFYFRFFFLGASPQNYRVAVKENGKWKRRERGREGEKAEEEKEIAAKRSNIFLRWTPPTSLNWFTATTTALFFPAALFSPLRTYIGGEKKK